MVDRQLNEESIAAHNELRKKHGCPELRFDENLAKTAQACAEHLASVCDLIHSECDSYGENLAIHFRSGNFVYSGADATRDWYNEIMNYNFDHANPEDEDEVGHFTQLIWKSTEKAGFGRATCPRGEQIIVGHYHPQGNYRHEYVDNVPRPLDGVLPQPERNGQMVVVGQMVAESPGPRNKKDTLLTRSTRLRKVDSMEIAIVTEEYETPNGDKYTVSKETSTGGDINKVPKVTKAANEVPTRRFSSSGARNPSDRLIRRGTQTHTINGVTSLQTIEVYQTPDGRTYDIVKETTSGENGSIGAELRSCCNSQSAKADLLKLMSEIHVGSNGERQRSVEPS